MYEMPENLRNTILRIFGDKGRSWIEQFPGILEQCGRRWNLTFADPLPYPSINYLINASLPTGEEVVLKVGVPDRELGTEIEALQIYGGRRIVICLDSDLQLGAMLLEKISPGYMLTRLRDNTQEARIAANIMRELPVACPAEHNLPAFAEWIEQAFRRYRRTYGTVDGPLEGRLLDAAEQAFQEVEDSKPRDVLLHGDLHHENILYDDRRGWLAIDPKGVIGDACLEVGRYLHNQLPNEMPLEEKKRLMEERVEILSAELAQSRQRIIACALIDKTLSFCWSTEESHLEEGWEASVAVARLLCEME